MQRLERLYAELKKKYPDINNLTYEQLFKFVSDHKLSKTSYLWLCARIVHDDIRCTPGYGGGDTWCNRFAARVFYLFTGETYIGTVENPILVNKQLEHINSHKGKLLGGLEAGQIAQNEANKGKFIVAISLDPDQHIAVIMPGVGEMNPDQVFCPAIAQQGSSNLLYGYTVKGHLNNGWNIGNNNKKGYVIQFYELR